MNGIMVSLLFQVFAPMAWKARLHSSSFVDVFPDGGETYYCIESPSVPKFMNNLIRSKSRNILRKLFLAMQKPGTAALLPGLL